MMIAFLVSRSETPALARPRGAKGRPASVQGHLTDQEVSRSAVSWDLHGIIPASDVGEARRRDGTWRFRSRVCKVDPQLEHQSLIPIDVLVVRFDEANRR